MKAFKVEFNATSLTPTMKFTVMAETAGEADQKALTFVRRNMSVPNGWTSLSRVTPVTLKPGMKMSSVLNAVGDLV